jgi:nitroreductase
MEKEKILEIRKNQFDVNELFPLRWSPRAFSTNEVDEKDLMSLFEAARWAASSYNEQPWRYIYAKKGSEGWNEIFSTLIEFNQLWAKNASYLIVIVSKDYYDLNKKDYFNSYFDTGASWQNFALQATLKNLITHAMGGFDKELLAKKINLPERHSIQAVIALGKKGNVKDLPKDLQDIEKISTRKKINEFVFENKFK